MQARKVRAGLRAFGRAMLSPLADTDRMVELTARAQQQLIRTDALPAQRHERRAAR